MVILVYQRVLCITQLAKVRPSTTLYYKACTQYVPVLRCTTKLAQSNFRYYFVLLSQNTFHLLTYHCRSLDARTPLRFGMSSCDNSITHAAVAPSNFDAATTMRSAVAKDNIT